ncbi:RNA demethylase ALKBH10B-like isoform X2 [Abrus precatorius]|uniref:RNA demethylase ALKBH10B-like isoform X2 n=1 Tax=Abrus precatorius TaxID=3816 RepID=A0A8B8LX15_ABRPR|nr:RNA demethylase ALKBH10B-like isoform X2 [Abrus precatorius]
MAMPSGNAVMPEKLQFPGGGSEIHYRQQWFVDERDGFISWIRSEFAAANAIIDSLCHHLRAVGDPGEYDMVVGAIQQRRCNWTQVLLMQQYFSVSEVAYALQQVAWRRQQRFVDPAKGGSKEFRKFSSGFRHGQRVEPAKEGYNSSVESFGHQAVEKSDELKSSGKVGAVDANNLASAEEKKGRSWFFWTAIFIVIFNYGLGCRVKLKLYVQYCSHNCGCGSLFKTMISIMPQHDTATNHQSDGILKSSGNSQGSLASSECEAVGVNEECISNSKGNDFPSMQNQQQSQNASTQAKTFIGNEMFDGKMVNVVDGLKLYEDLFDSTEVSKLVSLVNDLRVAGKRGQFQGSQTFVVSKRPMRGRGREMIQFGVPIADAPPDVNNATGSSKDKNVESMPSLFQDIIDRLAALQVMTVKPDACIVDFYNEGDHSQPNNWPPWFGRPVYMLFLTECDMTFGRIFVSDHPGDYRGAVKLSLVPGSLLVMQGKSTDFAKHAIPSIRKLRILVTFTKSQQSKSLPNDFQRLAPSSASHWVPPPSRSPNHMRGHKHYAATPATGVLPAPSIRPPPNGMQPLFVPAPVAPPMSFPAPVPIVPGSTGWTSAPPRHPPPRIPAPGTGVFLPPPGSGSSSQHLPGTLTELNLSTETSNVSGKENGKSNHNNTSSSPKGNIDGNIQRQERNGNADGTEVEQAVRKEDESNDKSLASH